MATIGVYLAVLAALVRPLGGYTGRLYRGERTFFSPVVGPIERFLCRIAGLRQDEEMDWKKYAAAMLGGV
jgi:K+-transporting ATPase ATPase A chain